MKKILITLTALLLAANAWGAPGSPTLWERAAYGNIPAAQMIDFRGYNGAITTTAEAIWPESAAYVPLAVAMSTPYCASSDQSADIAAGTGANTLTVKGINTSFAAFSETVTMHASDGRTSVPLATANVMLINSVEVATAGSGKTNAGIIQCGTGTNTAGDPAVVHAYIPVGQSKSMQAWYGVPSGYTAFCKNWQGSSYSVTAALTVQFLLNTYTNKILNKQEYLGFLNQSGNGSWFMPNTIKFPEKTIFKVDALGATSTGPISVRADCLLVKNDWVTSAQDLF